MTFTIRFALESEVSEDLERAARRARPLPRLVPPGVACPTCGAPAGAPCVALGGWASALAKAKGEPIRFFHMARRRAVWGPGS